MGTKKEFYQIAGINTTSQDFINEGFKVISFGSVKNEIMAILKDKGTADKFHQWNEFIEPNNAEMKAIQRQLNNIVFKESRGGDGKTVIGWENGESYLRYHSGIFYKWFTT